MPYSEVQEKARAAWGFIGTRNDVATTCRIYGVTEEQLMEYVLDPEVHDYIAEHYREPLKELKKTIANKLSGIEDETRIALD